MILDGTWIYSTVKYIREIFSNSVSHFLTPHCNISVPPAEVVVKAEEGGGLVNLTCLGVGAYPAPQARLFWSTG